MMTSPEIATLAPSLSPLLASEAVSLAVSLKRPPDLSYTYTAPLLVAGLVSSTFAPIAIRSPSIDTEKPYSSAAFASEARSFCASDQTLPVRVKT